MEDDDESVDNQCAGCAKVICLSCDQGDLAYTDVDGSGKAFCPDCAVPAVTAEVTAFLCFFVLVLV